MVSHPRYAELERLRAWRSELEAEKSAVDEVTRGVAGCSSVILSGERFVPRDGVLLKPRDEDA